MIRFNNKINIEKYNDSKQNENGFDIANWEDYYKCWSDYREIEGKEYIQAKATQSENIVTFTVRYCNKIKHILNDKNKTKIYRIKYNDIIYNIKFISDYKNLHKYVDFKCTSKI